MVLLYGDHYDLSGFDHPGGRHLIELLETSPDPELLLQYYHAFGTLRGALAKYSTQTGSSHCPKNDKFKEHDELRALVKRSIGQTRMAWYKTMDHICHQVGYLGYMAVYMTLLYGSWMHLVLAGFLYSFSTIWCTHGNSHGIGNPRLPGVSTLFSAVATLPWGVEHIRTHHVYSNQIVDQDGNRTDPDIVIGAPFIRMCRTDRWYWWHRFQCLYFYPMVAVSGIFIVILDVVNILRGGFGLLDHQIDMRRPFLTTRLLHLLQKLAYIFIWYILPGIHTSIPVSCMRMCWLAAFTGIANFFINTISHCNDKIGAPGDVWDVVALQMGTTVDVHPGNPVVNVLTAGLSHQVVHHLFPGFPFTSYPEISHILRREYTDRYKTFPTYFHAAYSQLRYLYRLGTEKT